MATKVFVSFRFNDGLDYKKELEEIFDSSTEIINRSEDTDRSDMSEETIRDYLYDKLKNTSVTILILTPEAVNYKKNIFGDYDDWLYDELRYSLEDRTKNRTNGVIALYTDDSEALLFNKSTHTCPICNETKSCRSLSSFDNLARKNMLNVKKEYKKNSCEGLYDDETDSYISLVPFEDFKVNYEEYINNAKEKRDRKDEFELIKKMR